jgi:hypothetical protein
MIINVAIDTVRNSNHVDHLILFEATTSHRIYDAEYDGPPHPRAAAPLAATGFIR